MIYITLILGFIAFLGFVIKREKNGSIPALLLKIATSVLFMTTAFVAVATSGNSGGPVMCIVTGLLMGLIGDVLLDLMFVYPRDSISYFWNGFICGGAHFLSDCHIAIV